MTMAFLIRLGSLWRSSITFIFICNIIRPEVLSQATSNIKIGELGYGRVTNCSIGEYNFLRVDCLKRVFPNFLNQTTVLPSLQATLNNDCPSDDGIDVDCNFFLRSRHVLHYLIYSIIIESQKLTPSRVYTYQRLMFRSLSQPYHRANHRAHLQSRCYLSQMSQEIPSTQKFFR